MKRITRYEIREWTESATGPEANEIYAIHTWEDGHVTQGDILQLSFTGGGDDALVIFLCRMLNGPDMPNPTERWSQ